MLEALRLLFERGDLLLRLLRLMMQLRDEALLPRMRRGDRLLALLHDLPRLGHAALTRRERRLLLAEPPLLRFESRDGACVARCDVRQHRKAFQRIARAV